jgi:hypothetical protein
MGTNKSSRLSRSDTGEVDLVMNPEHLAGLTVKID